MSPSNHTRATAIPQPQASACSISAFSRPVNISRNERILSLAVGGGLTLLGLKKRSPGGLLLAIAGGALLFRGGTGHCDCYEALGIDTSEERAATAVPAQQGCKVEETIVVDRPVAELYDFWRNFENLSQIMDHLVEVSVRQDGRSHWVAKGPLGTHVEWDAELLGEGKNEMIAWRSVPGSQVETAGSVHFHSLGDSRTEIKLSMKYNPPAGKVGAKIAGVLGRDAQQEIKHDLRRFKERMEQKAGSR